MTEEAESKKMKWHFPRKTEMHDNDFLWKKGNGIIGRTKTKSFGKPKTTLSSNRIKNIASSFFLHKNFAFIHRVAAFTLSVPDSDT